MDRLAEDIESWPDALFEDLVWQSLLLMWSLIEKPLEASPRSPENVVLFSLKVLEVDGDDLCLDLHGVEVELRLKY